MPLVAGFPAGQLESVPLVFRWAGVPPESGTDLVVLAPDYGEVARFDGIVGSAWPTPPKVVEALAEHGLLHWRVESGAPGHRVYSPLQTFAIR